MKLPAYSFLPILIAFGFLSQSDATGQEAPSRDRSSKEAAGKAVSPKGALKPVPKAVSKSEDIKVSAKPSRKHPEPAVKPSGIMILVEWIEVAHEDFSDWAFENKLSPDATDLRKEVQGWAKKDEAEIIRTAVVHARSGQRAKIESISEFIYPTEYDPAEIPTEANVSDTAELPVTPPNACAFETRNLGTTVEVDPVISEDGKMIDLNLAPELVFHLEDREIITKTNDETQIVTQPTMYAAKASTQVEVRNGGYALLGTLLMPKENKKGEDDRIVLLFVRADAE